MPDRRSTRRSATLLLTAAATLLAGGLTAPSSASASAVPVLEAVTYPVGPYARVGWVNEPVAQVELDAPAVSEVVVSVSSSDTSVATVPDSVVVPAGETSAAIPVTPLAEGTARLTATLGSDTVAGEPDLRVGGASEAGVPAGVSVDPSSVQPGEPAVGTVTLDFLAAPGGGTTVVLESDDAGVQVPASVDVPGDHTSVSFPIATDAAARTARITATVGEVTRSVELVVADTVAPETTITRTVVRHRKRSVTVRFGSSEVGSTFSCKLDQRPYRPCASPRVYRRVAVGRHIVRVKATDVAGNADPTPALDEFHVRR